MARDSRASADQLEPQHDSAYLMAQVSWRRTVATLPAEQAVILTDYGVPAHAEEAQPVERLALAVQHGHGVIAMVNAGVLWSDPRVLGHGRQSAGSRRQRTSG